MKDLIQQDFIQQQKPRRGYELRYKGTFGFSLYDRFVEYEDALIAKRQAIATALSAGDRGLAASFEVV